MKNNDLRAEIVRHGLYTYQVASKMGIKANSLSHYLMNDLSRSMKGRIKEAIFKAAEDLDNVKKE